MGVEVFEYTENDVVQFHGEIDYRDSDWKVLAVRWVNGPKYRWKVVIQTPTKGDISTIIEKGASGERSNVPNGYFIDGPQGGGYQLIPLND